MQGFQASVNQTSEFRVSSNRETFIARCSVFSQQFQFDVWYVRSVAKVDTFPRWMAQAGADSYGRGVDNVTQIPAS